MATRSSILTRLPDGRYKGIYCHFDGYPEYNGRILMEFYSSQERVDALMALGDLSVLGESTDGPDARSLELPTYGYCIAYGRDRGESDVDAREFGSLEEAIDYYKQCGVEYTYVWQDGQWSVNGESLAEVLRLKH